MSQAKRSIAFVRLTLVAMVLARILAPNIRTSHAGHSSLKVAATDASNAGVMSANIVSPSGDAIITVTTTADDITPFDGSVSLREAITASNAGNDLGDP